MVVQLFWIETITSIWISISCCTILTCWFKGCSVFLIKLTQKISWINLYSSSHREGVHGNHILQAYCTCHNKHLRELFWNFQLSFICVLNLDLHYYITLNKFSYAFTVLQLIRIYFKTMVDLFLTWITTLRITSRDDVFISVVACDDVIMRQKFG